MFFVECYNLSGGITASQFIDNTSTKTLSHNLFFFFLFTKQYMYTRRWEILNKSHHESTIIICYCTLYLQELNLSSLTYHVLKSEG